MAEGEAVPSVTPTEALEARLRALEAELAVARAEIDRRNREDRHHRRDSDRRSRRRDVADSTRETTDRAIDEVNRLLRGMTLAYAEGLRSAADAVGTFSDELAGRTEEDTDRERLAYLPVDIYASYLKAMNRALTIPERSVDRFQEGYRREEERQAEEHDRDSDVERRR